MLFKSLTADNLGGQVSGWSSHCSSHDKRKTRHRDIMFEYLNKL